MQYYHGVSRGVMDTVSTLHSRRGYEFKTHQNAVVMIFGKTLNKIHISCSISPVVRDGFIWFEAWSRLTMVKGECSGSVYELSPMDYKSHLPPLDLTRYLFASISSSDFITFRMSTYHHIVYILTIEAINLLRNAPRFLFWYRKS